MIVMQTPRRRRGVFRLRRRGASRSAREPMTFRAIHESMVRRETNAAGGDEKGVDLSTIIPGIAVLSFCHRLKSQVKCILIKLKLSLREMLICGKILI